MTNTTVAPATIQSRAIRFTLIYSIIFAIVMVTAVNLRVYSIRIMSPFGLTVTQKFGYYWEEACYTNAEAVEVCGTKELFPEFHASSNARCKGHAAALYFGSVMVTVTALCAVVGVISALRMRGQDPSVNNVRRLVNVAFRILYCTWAAAIEVVAILPSRSCGSEVGSENAVSLLIGPATIVVAVAAFAGLCVAALEPMLAKMKELTEGGTDTSDFLNNGIVESVEQLPEYGTVV